MRNLTKRQKEGHRSNGSKGFFIGNNYNLRRCYCWSYYYTAFNSTRLQRSVGGGEEGFIDSTADLKTEPKAPMAASGDGNNFYVVWWTNRSGNWEVMFRASDDGGQTFGDKINLSNYPDTQSRTAEILAVGNNIV